MNFCISNLCSLTTKRYNSQKEFAVNLKLVWLNNALFFEKGYDIQNGEVSLNVSYQWRF